MKILFDGVKVTEQCTTTKGVYCWVNTINKKMYIGLGGGKNGLRGRLQNEVAALKRGRHCSTQLLFEAVKKYGIDKFIVYCLYETEDTTLLGKVEQDFISMYKSITPHGYNITAGGSGTVNYTSLQGIKKRRGMSNEANKLHRAKSYHLIDPSGNKVTVTNLHSFCKAYELSESAMRRLVNDRAIQYKGWKNAYSTKEDYAKSLASTAYFVSKSGELVKVLNIKTFAKEVGASQGALNGVWTGRKHYNSCKGWRKATDEEIAAFSDDTHRAWEHTAWKGTR